MIFYILEKIKKDESILSILIYFFIMLLFKINTKKNLEGQAKDIWQEINSYYKKFKKGELSEEELRKKESGDNYMRKIHNIK